MIPCLRGLFMTVLLYGQIMVSIQAHGGRAEPRPRSPNKKHERRKLGNHNHSLQHERTESENVANS